jgi:hypothetical protein
VAEPTLNSGHIVAEFRKPDGELVYLPRDNAAVYVRKGYVLTGVEFSRDDWNVYAGHIDRWRAIGDAPPTRPLYPGPMVP